MLTLEINGKAIAVIDADAESARDLLEDEDFREDLQSITSGGEPMWDGIAPLHLRPANAAEEKVANEADDEDEDEEDVEEGDLLVVFLVPLDDEEVEDDED